MMALPPFVTEPAAWQQSNIKNNRSLPFLEGPEGHTKATPGGLCIEIVLYIYIAV